MTEATGPAQHRGADPPGPRGAAAPVSAAVSASVAVALAEAASAARRRGAPAVAARLAQLAAEHAPSDGRVPDAELRLAAAEDAVAAGDYPLARRIAHQVLAESEQPADRVRAWIVVVDSCGQAMAEIADVFPQALQDARDDPE